MEKEARPAVIAIPVNYPAEARDVQNPSAFSLFARIRTAASKFIAKFYERNKPFFPLEPTVPVQVQVQVQVQVEESKEEEISQSAPPRSPGRRVSRHHTILKMMIEQKLGKSVLNIGVATAIAVLVSGSKVGENTITVCVYIMVSGLCMGCATIWNGILLRETFPLVANVIELLGIVLALTCLNGLVGSFLPADFIWLPFLCGVWCLFPFIIMIFP